MLTLTSWQPGYVLHVRSPRPTSRQPGLRTRTLLLPIVLFIGVLLGATARISLWNSAALNAIAALIGTVAVLTSLWLGLVPMIKREWRRSHPPGNDNSPAD